MGLGVSPGPVSISSFPANTPRTTTAGASDSVCGARVAQLTEPQRSSLLQGFRAQSLSVTDASLPKGTWPSGSGRPVHISSTYSRLSSEQVRVSHSLQPP